MKKSLFLDFKSSLVVFLVALPLCLGIALASGAPLFSGLIAGIVGGLVVGALSGSNLSVSGPAAGLTVIVFGAINELGDFNTFTLAVLLAGLFQILLGFVKAGKLGDFFPNSVIRGMLAAIGLILILKQLPHAIGWDKDFMGDIAFSQPDGQNTFSGIFLALKNIHMGAVLICLFGILIIVFWPKFFKKIKQEHTIGVIPGPLLAVGFGILINQFFKVSIPSLYLSGDQIVALNFEGGLVNFFQKLSSPNWSQVANPAVYKVAFTIAVVASIESLLSLDAADKLDPDKNISSKNKELIAQGAGNAVSGLIGGLPVTAVIVRTTANISSGAKTRLSAIFHALWLFLFVAFAPVLIEMIPLSILAAVLLVVGFKLTPFKLYKEFYAKGFMQFAPFVITVAAILLTDLLIGILLGMIVGIGFVLWSNITKAIEYRVEGKDHRIKFVKDVSFFHKPQLVDIFREIPENTTVYIDGSTKRFFIDHDIEEAIKSFTENARFKNIKVNYMQN